MKSQKAILILLLWVAFACMRVSCSAIPAYAGESREIPILKNAQLEEIKPLGQGEQVFEGWVTIGHEVRSFKPCLRRTDLWILGEWPALKEVITAHRNAFLDRKRHAPLFMV